MDDFVEQWVRKAQAVAAHHPDKTQRGDLSADIAALIDEAKEQARVVPEGAKALAEVSGQLRMDVTAARSDRHVAALSALALAFSRASGELAGSPT